MNFPRFLIRSFLVACLFLLIVTTLILLAFKADYGMFIGYWLINIPIFVAYTIGIIWLIVEFFFLVDIFAARLKILAVLTLIVCSLITQILLCLRFEMMVNIPYWGCLLPMLMGVCISGILLVTAIHNTRTMIYDPHTHSYQYITLEEEKVE